MKKILFIGLLLWGGSALAALCGNFDSIAVGNKVIQNNVWNPGAGPQCITVTAGTGAFTVTSASHNMPLNGAPASYPSAFYGCHWGNCSPNNPLPRQLSGLTTLLGQLGTTIPTTGVWNAAYDIWLNTTPTASGQPNGQEIMIWTDYRPGIQPLGTLVATKTILRSVWQIWHGGSTTTYRKVSGGDGNTMTLLPFLNETVARGWANPAWYVIGVEYGFEIWQGQTGLSLNSFNLTVQ